MRTTIAGALSVALLAAACTVAPTATGQPGIGLGPVKQTTAGEIARAARDVPGPVRRDAPTTVTLALETREVVGALDDGATYAYWTFGGTVPGPLLRVRVADTVELKLKNASTSTATHSIDLHAVTGPGGGAGMTQVPPGGERTIRFKALNPGLYVYHCATPPVPMHLANGMYGLILVEPEGGLPARDRRRTRESAERSRLERRARHCGGCGRAYRFGPNGSPRKPRRGAS